MKKNLRGSISVVFGGPECLYFELIKQSLRFLKKSDALLNHFSALVPLAKPPCVQHSKSHLLDK